MARSTLLFSLISLYLLHFLNQTTSAATTTTAATTNSATNFITTSCKATTYPIACVHSLSPYASTIQKDPQKLIMTALTVSLKRAESTKTFVVKLNKFRGLKPREYAALRDCLEEIGDSVDRISKSVRELKNMGSARGPEYSWHMSNLQTWVSAALTDDSTCMDGFSGRAMDGKIKSSIRAQMTGVAQVTSNALALCNHFATKK